MRVFAAILLAGALVAGGVYLYATGSTLLTGGTATQSTTTFDLPTVAIQPADIAESATSASGNLALVAHLVGSPYLPPVKDGVLFLEDIGESPYRIERLLLQLHFCGVLGAQRAIVLGSFNGYEPGPNDGGHDLAAVVAQLRSRIDVPVYTGLPFGNVREKLTLPVGGQARLVVRDGRAQLALSGYA